MSLNYSALDVLSSILRLLGDKEGNEAFALVELLALEGSSLVPQFL